LAAAKPSHHPIPATTPRRGGPEGFEPQHRPYQSLDDPMILFDDIVEVSDLADLDACLSFGVVAFDRRSIGTALVDRNLLRRTVPLDRPA
jgi:hypothetical protein